MIKRPASAMADITERVMRASPGLPAELTQSRVIDQTAHRPWPLPHRQWLMAQTWRDLLFAHWALPPEAVRPLLPAQLPLDTFDGHAWVGITPFELSGLRPRGSPPFPVLSRFPELNVRTYTRLGGKPGIYFLSLDAASSLAVLGARRFYRLPYFQARMAIQRGAEGIEYLSERTARESPPAIFEANYRATGPERTAAAGSIEQFLTERYCLYTVDERGAPLRADIQHPPWPLQPAEAEIERNSMVSPWGLVLPDEPPLLHFSRIQNVLIWSLEPAGG